MIQVLAVSRSASIAVDIQGDQARTWKVNRRRDRDLALDVFRTVTESCQGRGCEFEPGLPLTLQSSS
jgi:hypothetical protein